MSEGYLLQNRDNGQMSDAIDRWDDEGGATAKLVSGALVVQINKLTVSECQILQCLGAAVVIAWNDLPTNVQRILFTLASTDGACGPVRDLPLRIARFLRNHKRVRPAEEEGSSL